MLALIDGRDIVVLHDPQTAGLLDGLRAAGPRVAWRCHIGRDAGNDRTDAGWAFLRPYIEGADAFVFSRRIYAPGWIDERRLVVIPPSIDPFAAKNCELDPPTVSAILATSGLIEGGANHDPIRFERRDGTTGTIRPHSGVIADARHRRPTPGSCSRSAGGTGSRTWRECSPVS
jgi:trehalose synthase